MKKIHEIDYNILKRDFIMVNVIAGGAVLFMLSAMLLHRWRILPEFPCVFHELFHLYCPGCGGTRALFALLMGDIFQSLYYNPAVVLGALVVGYYEIGTILTLVKKNGRYYFNRTGVLIYGYILIILIFTVVRNWLLVSFQVDMLKDFVK